MYTKSIKYERDEALISLQLEISCATICEGLFKSIVLKPWRRLQAHTKYTNTKIENSTGTTCLCDGAQALC